MSRTVRRQLIEILNTLKEANKLLESLFGGGQEAEIVNLLAGCQNCAITMGNKIEAVYGTGTASVHGLEEYCEIIFQLSQNIHNKPECLQIYEKMKEQLLLVEENMDKEIPDKREVVFMPYKASMWDALESVYLAAKEDESCEAYVVPIPYFDRQADGSLGAMHYEGNEYPKNIEVTDWQSYNLEERMPDVVYIHNPYDEYNRVTSVHPKFYSGNLKKYTEELVYIPYFVLPEIEPDDEAAIESVKHFLFLPGIVNADKVIVQSEKMKQIYINEYLKGAKALEHTGAHLDREKLEEKFLGLGSPKFDKVLNTRKEDLEIPEEWLRVIQKPDGTWKKIIFYNTSVTALLQYDVKMLEKMKYVFRVFKEQQEEVALLWRPHPLIKATIESMRPHLWKEYEKIVEEYRQEGWGIYDDTADMDRAVVLSDAYYGDHSSVVQVYRKTGKPVMVQNVMILKDMLWKSDSRESMRIDIADAVLDGDKIWFCAKSFNSLFFMDINTKKVNLVGSFPNEAYYKNWLYASMKLVGGKIYFVPFYAKQIAIYDIDRNEFSSIKINEKMLKCKSEKPFFMGIEEYKNYLYFLPVFSRTIIRLNIDKNELDYIADWSKQIEKEIFDRNDGYFRRQSVIEGNKLYVPFCNANAILELNCDTLKSRIYTLGKEKNGYSGICNVEHRFWLSPRMSGDLVEWSLEENKARVIKMYKAGVERKPYAYVGILDDNHKIIVFPAIKEERALDEKEKYIIILEGQYSFAKKENGNLLYYEINTGLLSIIDEKESNELVVKIEINSKDVDVEQLCKEPEWVCGETYELHLERLICSMTSQINKENLCVENNANIGKAIYTNGRKA